MHTLSTSTILQLNLENCDKPNIQEIDFSNSPSIVIVKSFTMEPMASIKKSETEGVDVISFMSNLSMSSSVSVTINDLPLEVLEKIIDRLDDRASVLNCRLVNSEWNAAAGKALENLCLSIWTRWEHRKFTKETPFPKIGSTPMFPFPTRSLYFNNFGWNEYKKTNKAAKIEMLQLLKLFGSHLTSLWIERMSLDQLQISIIFKELVNLKALTISGPPLCTPKWDAIAELTTKSPPNLQYLRLKWISMHLAQWIVDQCSSQLISLETVMMLTSKSEPRRHLKLPSSSGKNDLHITKLKLWDGYSDFFEQTGRLHLTHLSIDFTHHHTRDDHAHREISLKDVITFLNNFSGTLVQLYLRVSLGEDGGIIPFNEFPHLTEFFFWFMLVSNHNKHRLNYLTYLEILLKRFPNLERLLGGVFYAREGGMEQVREELNSHFFIQHCFQLCQKLETVTVNHEVTQEGTRVTQMYEITVSRDGDQVWKLLGEGYM